jgi:hypothetical protein
VEPNGPGRVPSSGTCLISGTKRLISVRGNKTSRKQKKEKKEMYLKGKHNTLKDK